MTTPHHDATLEQLQIAQETAQKLFEGLDADPTLRKTAHAAYARSLVGRLMMLESHLLETPHD